MKGVTKARVQNREDVAKAKQACPCGWRFPFVKATGEGLSRVTDLRLHVQCPDCGQEFSTDRTYSANEESGVTQ